MKVAKLSTVDSAILNTTEKENCILSPDSFFTLFGILYDAYDAETQEAMNNLYNRISNSAYIGKSVDLWNSNLKKKSKLILRTECQLKAQIKNKLENEFACEIEVVDETDRADDKNYSTCNLFQSPSLNNIININFQWANDFQKNKIVKDKFYRSDTDTIETEFMTQESRFGYRNDANLDAQIFEMQFSNESVSMFFIVPNNKENLRQLEHTLTANSLKQLCEIQKYPMKLSIPQVNFNSMFNLKNILQEVIWKDPSYKLATFLPSHIGKILTRASIEINESGTKATAASAFELILDEVVKEMTIETVIANRFAKTVVTNKLQNLENIAQEVTFNMILPEDAFISEFVMIIEGKSYKSYVKETKEARRIYDEAVEMGRGAAHVAVTARDSRTFTISVNIEPFSEATFLLTYEELLQRKFDQYELVLNIYPGQLVDVLKVLVKINECRKLKYVKTPAVRSGNDITNDPESTNTLSEIEVSDSTAIIKFEPDIEHQKHIACKFDQPEHLGFCGQFVVQYDVQLDPSNGEILISDGYFVHFYAPDDLLPLAKHVVFTLDTSQSMNGRKIDQLREAMQCILDQIRKDDLVDILEFTDKVTVYDIDNLKATVINYGWLEDYNKPFNKYKRLNLSCGQPVNENIIEKAKNVVKLMKATNSTHVIGGLETALYLVKIGQERYSDHQPIIIFLTDGLPNEGVTNPNEIIKIITKLNKENNHASIFSLSLGEEVDKTFLRKLSLNNFGFSRHIYEACDASLQLQQFYKQISSPLLSNVTFKYDSNVEDATRNYFPIYFKGSGIVVCGRYKDFRSSACVDLVQPESCVELRPTITASTTPIERLWAYLTIKQLLEQRESADNKVELTKKAVELALKYSFVTEVTSLVVVKPSESSTDFTKSEYEVPFNYNRPVANGSNKKALTYMSRTPTYVRLLRIVGSICMLCLSPCLLCYHLCCRRCYGTKPRKMESDVNALTGEIESPVPTEFKIDRPFLIMIQAKLYDRNVILFMGRVLEPVCEK